MNTENPIIRLRAVSKRFRHVQALDNVNLDIHPGHIVGLLGSNGAGKSTLLRHIIGLYLPDAGSCTTFGRAAGELDAGDLARVGYVHQEGDLLDWMTVKQLIRYVSAYYSTWNHELEGSYISEYDIDVKARVGSLSPGQRQKLAILLAIGFEPELLILDEPASALDPLARAQFLDLLLRIIQDEGRTIIISSHILSDVEKVIDHAVFMTGGRILVDSPFDALRERFARVHVNSKRGPLPESLPFDNVLHCRRANGQAVLTVHDCTAEQLHAQADRLGCWIEIETLPLEDIYRAVVTNESLAPQFA